MKSKTLLFLLILICSWFYSKGQLGKFNIGLNARLAFLTHIGSDATDYLDLNQETPKDIIFNSPITFRYTSNSWISLRYQIEYRKEYFNLMDKYSDSRINSKCKYLINSGLVLFKVNESRISNTSISIGLSLYHSFSENYQYQHYGQNPGGGSYIDTTFSYSTSEFNHLKSSIYISINRETVIKKTRISLYRELYFSTPIAYRDTGIPVFYSNEIGLTIGLSYNFKIQKSVP